MKNVLIGMLVAICLGSAIYGINLNNSIKAKSDTTQNESVLTDTKTDSNDGESSVEVSQNVIIDNEFVKIIVNSNMESQKGVYTNLYIENKTKESVTISIDKININNKSVSTRFEDSLSPGEKKVSDIRWKLEDVKNIKDLKLIKGTLTIKGYKKLFSGEIEI